MTNYLSDIITYVRRIIKSPSSAVITDSLIIDYINRFWIMDVDARIQLFDFKTTYQFQTTPGVDKYNMPLYSVQTENIPQTPVSVYLAPYPFPPGNASYITNLLINITPNQPTATLTPGTVEVWFDLNGGIQTFFQDDGNGNLVYITGPITIVSATVNYATGFVNFVFTSFLAANTPVNASFTYNTTVPGLSVAMYPVYQNMLGPCFINGIEMPVYTQRSQFYNVWPNYNQLLIQAGTGNGTAGPYTLNLPFLQNTSNINTQINTGIIRGHVDIAGIMATGVNQDPPLDGGAGLLIQNPTLPNQAIPSTSILPGVYFTSVAADGSLVQAADTGILLNGNQNYGLLMTPGNAPYGNQILPNTLSQPTPYSITQNTVNYITGIATNITFAKAIPNGTPINAQCVYYQTGIPRAVLFYNNVLTFRAPPNTSYLIELNAYLSPAAFFSSDQMVPFGYMCEYIARGAARKILSDVGDVEQFNFYEPLFKEQETLVHIRSQRQWTATRTPTIYSQQGISNNYNSSSFGV